MQNNKYLAAALAVCLTLSGCANRETQQTASVSSTGGEQVSSSLPSSQSQSQEPEQMQTQEPEPEQQTQEPEQTPLQSQQEQMQAQDLSAQESDDKNLLSLEEIKTVFSNLDAQANEMLDWVQKDYSQIPIAGIPVHKVDNAVVDLKWVSMNAENPDAGGFQPIYGTAVFAKVTEETLPGFPWKSVDEINDSICNIYESVSDAFGLGRLTRTDLNDLEGIFYQFDDGLYFRTNYTGTIRDISWDYSTIYILQNEPDVIQVQIYEENGEITIPPRIPEKRGIVKNENGNWVLTETIWQ